MGLNSTTTLGRNQRFYVESESAFGTAVKATSTGAIKVTSSTFEQTIERINQRDSSQTGSTINRIPGRKTTTWSVEMYATPSGTAGTPPDMDQLLRKFFGTYANVASTSDTYTIADSQTARGSLSITREQNGIFMQCAVGAWVEQFKIAYTGTSVPMFSFEGGAKDLIHTGYATLNGAMSASASGTVASALSANLENGSVVQIGSSNNSSAGFTIAGKTGPTDHTFTIDSAITESDGAAIIPYVPSQTVSSAVPISHTACSLTLDGSTLPVVSFEIVGKNNFKIHDDEAGTDTPSDLNPQWRDITGTVSVRANRDQILHLGKYRNATSTVRAMVVTCGSSAGNRFVITNTYAEIENAKFEGSDDDGIITLPFFCRGSAGADESSIAWT